ncbi:MAG: aldehyde dehydrogenase (NADP(+)) [Saprospiraceae bacterium]
MTITEDNNNLISGKMKPKTLTAVNPVTRKRIPKTFNVATTAEINAAVQQAAKAGQFFRKSSGAERAKLLRTIAQEIENLGTLLVQKVQEESGLPEGRVVGERGRTCNQLRQFADLVEEGSWVEATIQPSDSGTGIRKMLLPLGPVAVFTASNFPLAFSTAGGDTASALAAGCSVIVKAHPSHLGTNALVADAIENAIEKCNLPKDIFASLNGEIAVGQELVQHPLIKAVGFTGSHKGGKAIFDLVNSRPEPIPVYAEMGSTNPIFILQETLAKNTKELAQTLANSVNLGAGQFCTNPGILVMEKGSASSLFLQALKTAFAELQSAPMLNEGIHSAFEAGKATCLNQPNVTAHFQAANGMDSWKANPAFATVSAKDFLQNEQLHQEVFGPFTLLVLCEDYKELLEVAKNMPGQLTATIMGETEELQNAATLVEHLSLKAGRVIFNDVPTGVAVCPAMHHGGPYPATTSGFHTSVGMDAIKRFVRPVAYQNTPEFLLPAALKSDNPLRIWRSINGKKVQA